MRDKKKANERASDEKRGCCYFSLFFNVLSSWLGDANERIKTVAINYDVTRRNLLNKIKTLLQLFCVFKDLNSKVIPTERQEAARAVSKLNTEQAEGGGKSAKQI